MTDLIDKNLIFKDLEAASQDELFTAVGSRMIEYGFAKEGYIEELNKREKAFPTGVPVQPIGVAIPHTEGHLINENRLAVVTLKNPITFEIMGSDHETMSVSLVIFIGMHNGKEHMAILQRLIELIQNAGFVSILMKAITEEEIYQIMNTNLEAVGGNAK